MTDPLLRDSPRRATHTCVIDSPRRHRRERTTTECTKECYIPPLRLVRISYRLLDLADGLARVEVFGARLRAVHDRVASV